MIRKVSNSNISSIAGNHIYAYSGDNGPATSAQLNTPLGVATDAGGDVYIADSANNVVRMVTKGGAIYNVLGNGVASTSGLSNPEGLVVDSSGNLYIADSQNARVQKVTPSGSVSTVAGNGKPGYGGDGGAATSAQLNAPLGLALDSAGNLYISDFSNNRVRKVSASGTITTVAGTGMTGYSGDGAAATNAQLTNPEGLAVDFAGNLYIADSGNNAVRKVSSSGLISTVAGNGFAGYSGDGGPAIQAMVGNPFGVAVDAVGNLYISDFSLRVRKVYPDGTINTIAGTSAAGYSGDGGPALSATLNRPSALAVNSNGTVYVADSANSAIRSLVPSGPGVTLAAVVNGASGATGAIAPGEVAVLWLWPGTQPTRAVQSHQLRPGAHHSGRYQRLRQWLARAAALHLVEPGRSHRAVRRQRLERPGVRAVSGPELEPAHCAGGRHGARSVHAERQRRGAGAGRQRRRWFHQWPGASRQCRELRDPVCHRSRPDQSAGIGWAAGIGGSAGPSA